MITYLRYPEFSGPNPLPSQREMADYAQNREAVLGRAANTRDISALHSALKGAKTANDRKQLHAEILDRAWLLFYEKDEVEGYFYNDWDSTVRAFRAVTSEGCWCLAPAQSAYQYARKLDILMSGLSCERLSLVERNFTLAKMAKVLAENGMWADEVQDSPTFWNAQRDAAIKAEALTA